MNETGEKYPKEETRIGIVAICAAAGLDVFATGGIGGVHRGAPYDESADLAELGRTRAVVVCAGAKSILDLPATLERLETHGVTVIGYRTNEFPGFFTPRTGLPVPSSADSAAAPSENNPLMLLAFCACCALYAPRLASYCD